MLFQAGEWGDAQSGDPLAGPLSFMCPLSLTMSPHMFHSSALSLCMALFKKLYSQLYL